MGLKWIESGGGPLVLANLSLAGKWCGISGSSVGAALTDYYRACEIEEEIGIVSVGKGWAVVLGDEPDRTSLLRQGEIIYILRWRWASSEESLVQYFIENIASMDFFGRNNFLTKSGKHILFDSACQVVDGCDYLEIDLDGDSWIIDTTLLEPDQSVCAVVHRMRLL